VCRDGALTLGYIRQSRASYHHTKRWSGNLLQHSNAKKFSVANERLPPPYVDNKAAIKRICTLSHGKLRSCALQFHEKSPHLRSISFYYIS
jgi:hypothetical protein